MRNIRNRLFVWNIAWIATLRTLFEASTSAPLRCAAMTHRIKVGVGREVRLREHKDTDQELTLELTAPLPWRGPKTFVRRNLRGYGQQRFSTLSEREIALAQAGIELRTTQRKRHTVIQLRTETARGMYHVLKNAFVDNPRSLIALDERMMLRVVFYVEQMMRGKC